eukprot:494298-Hanusia_phi.AAC.1
MGKGALGSFTALPALPLTFLQELLAYSPLLENSSALSALRVRPATLTAPAHAPAPAPAPATVPPPPRFV